MIKFYLFIRRVRLLATHPAVLLLLVLLMFNFGASRIVFADHIEYIYDSNNRLIEVHYPDKIIRYTYDAAGNRTSVQIEALNLVPILSSLTPGSAAAGGDGFTLIVNGSNFVDGAVVQWNGVNRTTTFFNSTKLTIDVSAGDIAATGTASVTVVNPTPGGGASNTVSFTISNPAPTPTPSPTPVATLQINSVTPRAGRSSGGQQIRLTGVFAGLSVVTVGGVPANWSYTNGTSEITVTTPQHTVGAVSIDLAPASGNTYSKNNAFAYLPTIFTDDTLVTGVTTAKAEHIIELREAVDAMRAVAGLAPAPWTDAALLPASTTIKAVHIQELRSYLDDAATRLDYATQPYTDPSLTGGYLIKKVYIEELRQRIRTIAG